MRNILLISALILVLLGLPAFAAEETAPPQADALYNIDITGAPYLGPVDAPVTIIEFIDYQ